MDPMARLSLLFHALLLVVNQYTTALRFPVSPVHGSIRSTSKSQLRTDNTEDIACHANNDICRISTSFRRGRRRIGTFVRPSSSSSSAFSTRSVVNGTYEHDGWTCAYREMPPAPGHESDPPLLLIHPVGIGISSWLWERTMDEYPGHSFAPDLIGCGDLGGDKLDPEVRGLSFPLGWAKQCEALIRQRVRRRCIVVVQGAVASVGVLMSSRDSRSRAGRISALVLCSPPTWEDMVTAIPERKLRRNYGFYTSRWGQLTFRLLENRGSIRLFSNLFLFEGDVDDRFLDLACAECRDPALRPPIMAFNAGVLQHRSYEEELTTLEQPTLILSGTADVRNLGREEYGVKMRLCQLKTIPGKNVLPWESPYRCYRAMIDLQLR